MTATFRQCPRNTRVANAFGRAADTYDDDAALQHEVACRLAHRIAALPLPAYPTILEIGCGTGFLTRALAHHWPTARWILTDIAPAMLTRCRQNLCQDVTDAVFVAMDGEHPCFKPPPGQGFDLICTSLALQWFTLPQPALAAWADLLAPRGHMAYATLSAGTFAEWRAAHAALGLKAGVAEYPEANQWAAWWPDGGQGRIETEVLQARYADGMSFINSLKKIGANIPVEDSHPLTPGALRRLLRHVASPTGMTITYNVTYGSFCLD